MHGIAMILLYLISCQCPDYLCRRTKCEASVRNIGALGDKSARTYYAVFTNPCSI